MKAKIRLYFSFVIFLLSLVLFTNFGQAQEFRGGFLAGLTSTQLDGDLYSGFNKAGITAGVYVNRQLSEKSGVQFELRYFEKGSKEDDTKDGGSTYYLSKINYIEIPVLYQYFVKNFVFEAGLSAGVLVKQSEEDKDGLIPNEYRIEFNRFEIASQTGFKYLFTDKISGVFRFSYSVIPVRKNYDASVVGPEYSSGKYSYNNCISVALYYQLDSR
jgi:hypothetical protein